MAIQGFALQGYSQNPVKIRLYSEAALFPFIVCFMGWLWSAVTFLFSIEESSADSSAKVDILFFRVAVIFPMVYLLAAFPFFLIPNSTLEMVILPLHLIALLCLIYVFYFVSKSLVMAAEKGKQVMVECLRTIFLSSHVHFISIWLIQRE